MAFKIESHISYLLHEHNCVILPDFGGFVANYKPARIDPIINLIHPPKKHIVFNQNLQNNDGLLANEVAACEGVSFKKAQEVINDYVLNLNDRLRLYKKFTIPKVGTLMKSNDGTLLFVQDLSTNHLLDSYGANTLQSPIIKRESIKERVEKKIQHLDDNDLIKKKINWIKAAAVLLPLMMVSLIGITQKEKINLAIANLNPFIEKIHTEKIEGTINYEIYYPAKNITKAIGASFKEKIKTEVKIDSINPKHFIIAGAFSSKKNAKKLVTTLQRQNYKNARIIGKNKSGLYRVCYDNFTKKSAAINNLRKIKQKNSSAWVLSF